jgi:DNA-directed RNA polymerase subunit M/transcription elongation factor TFIIS
MTATRIHCTSELVQCLSKHTKASEIIDAVVILEAYAWIQSVKSTFLHGIPIWSYSNGSILFETSKHEQHLKERLSSYFDYIDFIKILLADDQLALKFIRDPTSIANTDCLVDPRPQSAFNDWQTKYLDSIKSAKSVLEETIETKEAFIQCGKCKSHAVDTEQKQTRSADEPMTIFCVCRKCKHCFRID